MSVDIGEAKAFMDPFASVFRMQRLLVFLTGMAFVVCLIQGYWMRQVALKATVHAFEIAPNGEATYVGDRQSRIFPAAYEAKAVGRRWVELAYGWNGATIFDDLAEAVSMCSAALGQQLRTELGSVALGNSVRERPGGVRSEVTFRDVRVLEHSRRISRVYVDAQVARFGLLEYNEEPFETRSIQLEIVMQAVRRSEARPNGLEIVRVGQGRPADAQGEG